MASRMASRASEASRGSEAGESSSKEGKGAFCALRTSCSLATESAMVLASSAMRGVDGV